MAVAPAPSPVQADGTVTFDPSGNFEDLSTGDTDTVTLIYTISDGNGGSDCADLNICITGVNDPPVANNDGSFFVEFGDMAIVDVLANDTDVDGTIDPLTLAFSGADNGTAVNDAGQLKYTAFNPGYDTTNSSVNDPLTYTVDDNEGATSNVANVTAKVIDPLRETDTDSSNASNGQPISLVLSTEDRTYNDSSFVEVDITTGGLSQDVNVSFVIDGSGSITASEYAEQRTAVQNTIDDLRTDYTGSAATVTVQIVEFSTSAQQGTWGLFDDVLNNVATGTPLSSQAGGSTNYEAGLDLAVNFFTGNGSEDNFLLFTSDGAPNNPSTSTANFTDEVSELEALNVSRTAVGFGAAN